MTVEVLIGDDRAPLLEQELPHLHCVEAVEGLWREQVLSVTQGNEKDLTKVRHLAAVGVCITDELLRLHQTHKALDVALSIPSGPACEKYRDTALFSVGLAGLFAYDSSVIRSAHDQIHHQEPRTILTSSAFHTFIEYPEHTEEDAFTIALMMKFDKDAAERQDQPYTYNSARLRVNLDAIEHLGMPIPDFRTREGADEFLRFLYTNPTDIAHLELCIALLETANIEYTGDLMDLDSVASLLSVRTQGHIHAEHHVIEAIAAVETRRRQLAQLERYLNVSPREYALFFTALQGKMDDIDRLIDRSPQSFLEMLHLQNIHVNEFIAQAIQILSKAELDKWLPLAAEYFHYEMRGYFNDKLVGILLNSIPDGMHLPEHRQSTGIRLLEYVSQIQTFSEYDRGYLSSDQLVELVEYRTSHWESLVKALSAAPEHERMDGYMAYYQLGERFQLVVNRAVNWQPETVVEILQTLLTIHPDEIDGYLRFISRP